MFILIFIKVPPPPIVTFVIPFVISEIVPADVYADWRRWWRSDGDGMG